MCHHMTNFFRILFSLKFHTPRTFKSHLSLSLGPGISTDTKRPLSLSAALVRNKRYRNKESGFNFCCFPPSKLKPLLVVLVEFIKELTENKNLLWLKWYESYHMTHLTSIELNYSKIQFLTIFCPDFSREWPDMIW